MNNFQMNNINLILNKAIIQNWKIDSYSYTFASRPDYGLLYLNKGLITYYFDDCVIELKPGDMIYLPRGCYYSVTFDYKNSEVENILINFDAVENKTLFDFEKPSVVLSDTKKELYSSLLELAQEYNDNGGAFYTNMLLYKCLNEISQMIEHSEGFEELLLFKRTAEKLSKNFGISIEDICCETNMSRSIFQKKFKKYLGASPIEFRNKKRIEAAKLLLETSDISSDEIVDKLKFYDKAYFYKVFKKETSLTPKQYRDKCAKYY